MKNYDWTIELYANTDVVKQAYSSFKNDLRGIYTSKDEKLIAKLRSINYEVLTEISGLQLKTLFITITKSNSIFYRFSSLNSSQEFKFEIFSDFDEQDESDIQAALHVYKDGEKESSTFGDCTDLFNIINDLISENSTYVYRPCPEVYNISKAFPVYQVQASY